MVDDWLLQIFYKSDVLEYVPVTFSSWVSFCLFVGHLICWSIHFECFLSAPEPQLGYMSLCVVGVISGCFFSAYAVTHQTKNRCKTIQVVFWGRECMMQMQWLRTDTKRQTKNGALFCSCRDCYLLLGSNGSQFMIEYSERFCQSRMQISCHLSNYHSGDFLVWWKFTVTSCFTPSQPLQLYQDMEVYSVRMRAAHLYTWVFGGKYLWPIAAESECYLMLGMPINYQVLSQSKKLFLKKCSEEALTWCVLMQ